MDILNISICYEIADYNSFHALFLRVHAEYSQMNFHSKCY